MEPKFYPPIHKRPPKDLLLIIAQEEDWHPEAVKQARAELVRRNIGEQHIAHARYLEKKRLRLIALRKEKDYFSCCEIMFSPITTLFQLTFLWEFKKDGYLRKAEQQKKFRVLIVVFLILLFLYVHYYGC
jgi:hypothetical protein